MAMAIDETVRGVVNYKRWRTGRWRVTSALAPTSTPPPASIDAVA
jgi:Na+-driven multidrug efflux pump